MVAHFSWSLIGLRWCQMSTSSVTSTLSSPADGRLAFAIPPTAAAAAPRRRPPPACVPFLLFRHGIDSNRQLHGPERPHRKRRFVRRPVLNRHPSPAPSQYMVLPFLGMSHSPPPSPLPSFSPPPPPPRPLLSFPPPPPISPRTLRRGGGLLWQSGRRRRDGVRLCPLLPENRKITLASERDPRDPGVVFSFMITCYCTSSHSMSSAVLLSRIPLT